MENEAKVIGIARERSSGIQRAIGVDSNKRGFDLTFDGRAQTLTLRLDTNGDFRPDRTIVMNTDNDGTVMVTRQSRRPLTSTSSGVAEASALIRMGVAFVADDRLDEAEALSLVNQAQAIAATSARQRR